MAEIRLLGLFDNAEQTSEAVEALHGLGVPDSRITIMSSSPYRPRMFGRPHIRTRLGWISFLGAILGVGLATFLTVGMFLLYPLVQGGQPIVPIPPSLIVYFEVIMLGTMYATFFGMLVLNGFPVFKQQAYDPRVTLGQISVEAIVADTVADQAVQAMDKNGASDVIREDVRPTLPNHGFRNFWIGFLVAGGILTAILGLFVYDIIRIPFPSNMVDQDSVAYDQGPRLAAPAAAIPIQGAALINGQPGTDPLPSTPASVQRGKVQYGITCLVCHGATGAGNGTLSGFFNPKPADLTSAAVQGLTDQELFLVITNGFGIMPPYYENLYPADRWNVINYVRTLKK